MKKINDTNNDDLRPEYNNETLGKGVRGKFLASYNKGTNLILLNPEIAKAFATSAAVNEALSSLLQLTKQTIKLTSATNSDSNKR